MKGCEYDRRLRKQQSVIFESKAGAFLSGAFYGVHFG